MDVMAFADPLGKKAVAMQSPLAKFLEAPGMLLPPALPAVVLPRPVLPPVALGAQMFPGPPMYQPPPFPQQVGPLADPKQRIDAAPQRVPQRFVNSIERNQYAGGRIEYPQQQSKPGVEQDQPKFDRRLDHLPERAATLRETLQRSRERLSQLVLSNQLVAEDSERRNQFIAANMAPSRRNGQWGEIQRKGGMSESRPLAQESEQVQSRAIQQIPQVLRRQND